MGYASPDQVGKGIHLRQFARCFVISDEIKHVAICVLEASMIVYPIVRSVVEKMQKIDGKDRWSDHNIMITASHTHSGVGGYVDNLVYQLPTFGYVDETFQPLVNGICNTIQKAAKNMQASKIIYGETDVLNISINRSPSAYLANPQEERMKQMLFVGENDKMIGVLNFYPIHPTSMNNTNVLVSSDNVGYAALLLEKKFNPTSLTGEGTFVAAFALTNHADVSPNTKGPRCEFTGKSCNFNTSDCLLQRCIAPGPGRDMFESTKIIGTRLFEGALKIITDKIGREVTGNVNYIHQFIDMSTSKFENVSGCDPAVGVSVLAGTTDGPGLFIVDQGFTTPLISPLIPQFKNDFECHKPKPILVIDKDMIIPYEWLQEKLPTQGFIIGGNLLLGVPGEITTMGGRRIEDTIRKLYGDVNVIAMSLCNSYGGYIVTREEYDVQRYEGASTLFGPHTLQIIIEQFKLLCNAMLKNEELPIGPIPPNYEDKMIPIQSKVWYDAPAFFQKFGDVQTQPREEYRMYDTVCVTFCSANPRNDLRHGGSYMNVERKNDDGTWKVVANDASWETKWIWGRPTPFSVIFGDSQTTACWEIPDTVEAGTYRISHFGKAKALSGKFTDFGNSCRPFNVIVD
ncbi:Neutral ceramidase [Pseudolycoriella hygida]|uniref:Neutral ceramidase n=1 Tax=Pseudolycoriella hygida TaxID=35572 RepID=A0A9Q0RWC7_9DIPT|nr:Neutral ceramidase [Pseudolycoriella hygida]